MNLEAYEPTIERILASKEEIAATIARLAERIAADYAGKPLLLIGVLKGALHVSVDLAREISRRVDGPSEIRMEFICVSSYGNATRSSGEVRMLKDVDRETAGQNVLIVEDIIDNGHTLAYLRDLFERRNPSTLRSCVLFDKPYRRLVNVPVEYVGMAVPDEFVVGYGLDYQELYRNLPYLAQLKASAFSS